MKKYLHIKLLIVISLSILFGHSAFGQTQTYIDEFNSVSYNNNNGTHNFSNNWTEFEDINNGSPNDGYVRITSGSLSFRYLYDEGVYRNLSIPENANAVFSCSFTTKSLENGEILDVQLWNTSTSDWETIASIDNSTSSGTISYTLTANHKSANSGVRFINGGDYWDSNNDKAYIDNVKFEVTITPPNITASGDQDFCLSSGNTIAIAESVNITGPGTGTSEVYVQVSSGYVSGEDLLTLTGSHSGISSSWNATEGKLTLSGNPEASYEQFENAILDVVYSNSNLSASGNRDFAITVGDANYLPSSGHYYEYVSAPNITWTQARDAAKLRTYFGLKGYLATLTSAEEGKFAGTQSIGVGWIGGSDAHTEGVWRWVTGPEGLENGGLGRQFWQGNINGNATAPDNYHFWNTGEPNNVGSGGEDYAHITHENVGPSGSWNDLPNVTSSTGVYASQGYVVEYGGFTDDPPLSISASTSLSIKPNASIELDPSLGSNIQTVCINTAITDISYAVSNATGASLTSGSFPNGVTGSYASGIYTISGTPTGSGVFEYTITTTGGCGNAEQKGTIIVNNPITISSSNLKDASCRTNADGEVEIALTGGNSIHFDGTDSYIALNLNYNATNAIPEMTVAAWVKVGPNSGGGDWAILDLDRSEYFNFTIGNSDNDYHVSFNTHSPSGNVHDFNSTTTIGDDQWHFVVGVYNSTGKYIYIDGVLDNSTSSVHSGNALGSTIRRFGFIGAGSEASTFNGGRNGGEIFEGNLADVWLFESSITDPNELNALSKGIIPSGHSVRGYWKLNDISNITNLADPSSGEQVFGIDNSNVTDLYQFTCTKDGAAFDLTGNITSASTNNFKLSNLGVGDYVLSATTNNECSGDISFTIANGDVTPPDAVCQDITIQLDNLGNANITAADINNGSTDNCTAPTALVLTIDKSAFDCSNVGDNVVTLTVEDQAGNKSTCTATVTVEDNVAPSASNPDPITVQCISDVPTPHITVVTDEADNCTATPTVAWVSDSNNGGLGTTASPYIVTRIYSVSDDAGNNINVKQTITAIDDEGPVVTTLADVKGECSATAVAPTLTDACAGTITGTTTDPLIYNTQGTYEITWTFDDGLGDGTSSNPFKSLGAARTVTSNGRYYFDLGNGIFQADVDTSEGGGWVLILQYHHAGGTNPATSVIGVGNDLPINSNASLGTDLSGNSAYWGHVGNAALSDMAGAEELRWYAKTSAHSRVIHFRSAVGLAYAQTGAGSFNGIESGYTLLSGHSAKLPSAARSEYSNQADNALVNFPFWLGATYHWGIRGNGNRWEVDDYPNNYANSTIHKVWVRGTLTSVGNVVTATQKVIVDDVTAPVTPVLTDVTVGECSGTPTAPTTTDNCAGTITGTTSTVFPITTQGTTVVTWTFDDGNGNTTTTDQNVIIKDITLPTIDCPGNITQTADAGSCGAVVTYTTPVGADNCAGASTVQTAGLASGSTFPIGTTTNTFEVTDAAGNKTSCSFDVTISDDKDPVIVNLPTDITVGACNNVTWTEPTATDNCSVTLTKTHNSGDVFPVGTTQVTYTATDATGNTDIRSFNVTVLPVVTISLSETSPILCNGDNAEVTITAGGGDGSYTYSKDGTNYQASNVFSLQAGAHTLYVKDGKSCVAQKEITITEPNAILTNLAISTSDICFGDAGIITIENYESDVTYTLFEGMNPIAYTSSVSGSDLILTIDNTVLNSEKTYNITIRAERGGCTLDMDASVSITVEHKPLPSGINF